jgi:hypothetical protein
MRALFSFFADQRAGILMFLLTLIVLTGVTQWVLWILGRGRFSSPSSSGVFRELITKIIYEFRHLLALAIVLLFSVALFFAIWPGVMGGSVQNIREGLQAVAATLGGLIGSIIGYYFGESAAGKGRSAAGLATPPPEEPAENAPPQGLVIPPKPPGIQ